jgi:transcription-repair coupling factor (superfamily II helicase)
VAQELAVEAARLVGAARHVLGADPALEVLVFPTDTALARAHEELSKFLGPEVFASRVVTIPGFIQAGVFRYESARKAIAMRISSLYRLLTGEPRLVLTSVRGIGRFAPSPTWIASHGTRLVTGQDIELEDFVSKLEKIGYLSVSSVEEVGDFAVRGGIVDLWIPGQPYPSRVDTFGDQVDEIRSFRPADGRSIRSESELVVLPCREFDWPQGAALEQAVERLNFVTLAQRMPGQARADLFENLRQSVPFLGIDDAAAVFFGRAGEQYVSLVSFIKEVAAARGFWWVVRLAAPASSFDAQLAADIQIYDRAAATALHKGTLFTPHSSVFLGLSKVGAGDSAPSFQAALGGSVNESVPFGVLPDSLRVAIEDESCRKAKGRLELLVNLLPSSLEGGNSSLVNRVYVGIKNPATLPEVRGFLGAAFAGLLPSASLGAGSRQGEGSDSEKVPWGIPRDFFAPTPVAAADVPDFFVGDVHTPVYAAASRVLVVSESWIRGASHVGTVADLPVADDNLEVSPALGSRTNAQILMQAQFSEFREGDLVVHVQHGIGRFVGLATVKVADASGDFLVIEYAGKDKIYVPIDKLNLVQRYIGGDSGSANLDSLKGQTWEKKREKARKDAEVLAKQMMAHQARRHAAAGHAFGRHEEEMMAFEATFPFDETPDQLKTLREIGADMCADKAMDRLLCGDVGFGKTEVAMRAAFRAILDGVQVAWLVPTTVLAHQHFRSAQERYSAFGVKVALLDRGQGQRGMKQILESLKAGQIDLVIGTHRILSEDVVFRRLGLLVVDEEQRFGVLQKERIKNMSYGVDVLTMTATPIPRTLQLAMLGLRDLSLLTTPPKSRLAVKTLVSPFDDESIKFALETEMARAGQTFYVHNRVEDLPALKVFLEKLVPGLRVAVGHGQMQQKDLDEVVIGFLDGKADVLLCTTIIESGIDMPNVNTIIVQDADRFGLAQLYQLRGRVGRRSSRGYAYLLLSPGVTEKDEGYKRIEILREHQALGSGFVIASHDLEMRGGGHILGDDQSGHMTEVGFETYNQMLDDAIQSLGGVRTEKLRDVDVKLPVDVKIPESYIQSSQERLRYYRRFFAAGTEDVLTGLLDECADRFGTLPPEVTRLALLARTKRLAALIHAITVTVSTTGMEIRLEPSLLQGDPGHEDLVRRILDVCNRRERDVRLTPDGRILYLGLKAADFVEDRIDQSFAKLHGFLALLSGAGLAS